MNQKLNKENNNNNNNIGLISWQVGTYLGKKILQLSHLSASYPYNFHCNLS